MFAAVSSSPVVSARPLESGRVWVVEDSPLEAEMARRALAIKHEVELFADGATLLERIANGARPDALVLDSQLPTLPGIEVCRFIRASYDEMALPILMLTIEGQRSAIVDGLASGANDYLTKPYDVAELLARVGVLVRTSHLSNVQARRSRHVALAAEVGAFLAQGGEDVELSRLCASSIVRHLDATISALFAANHGGVVLETAAGPQASLAPTSSVLSQAATRIATGEERQVIVDASAEIPNTVSLAAVPLALGPRIAGVLAVGFPRRVQNEDLDALVSLAQLLALGLERVRAERDRAMLLERELRARAEAEAATRAKDEFLALVSHELRTPLNAILGWSDLLLDPRRQESTSLKRGLDVIRRSALSQSQLIDDLLDVSRIMSGKLRIDHEPVDLVEVVESAVEAVRPSAANASVHLGTDFACSSAPLTGDMGRLKQVVSNLLTNAIKFTPKGGAVNVRVARNGGSLEVRVEDTGRGISPDFLPRVFERFRQADGSMRRRHGGLGLGLSLVRHIAELHGGTVAAFSEGENRGATFVVSLPAGDAPARPRGVVDAREAPTPDVIEGVSVLYVDDDADARDFVSTALTDAGARVQTASSVPAALEILATSPPDIVVSDVGMPGEDGFALVRHVRQLQRARGGDTPVIALTAYGQLDDRLRSEAAGFDLHLTKPIPPMHLVGAIARLTRGRATT
jgi:signal transduction histidine kinase/DNA-binding response OmpR family regulator